MIGPVGHSHADSEVEFPGGRNVQVYTGEQLLLLVMQRVKARNRTQRAIIFETRADLFGDVIPRLEVRRELKAPLGVGTMDCPIERRVERQVEPPQLLIDDRAYLPGPGVNRILAPLVTDLV